MFSVFIQKSTPIVGIPAEVNTPSVYLRTILVLPTPASPELMGILLFISSYLFLFIIIFE